jgi:hypothetical protein
VKKIKRVLCCRRRSGQLPCANAQFADPPRNSVMDTRYAVTNLKGNSASGMAEQTRACSRNVGSSSQHFVNKLDQVPCCRRRFCRVPSETPGLNTHRVTRVMEGCARYYPNKGGTRFCTSLPSISYPRAGGHSPVRAT